MHNFSPYKNSFRPSQGFPKVHEGTAGGLWVDEKLIIDLNFKINIIINTKKNTTANDKIFNLFSCMPFDH